jgi:thiol-disulfide isomerase/thioredoxin
MRLRHLRAGCLFICTASIAWAQNPNLNPDAPRPGTAAPELSFTNLLQAPAGDVASLHSLRGKVVVLEFWATWCAPCVAEIPIVNSLAGSLNPGKVQFIAVDDEAPAVVQAFLKKKQIKGWVGLDTSDKMFKRYGVVARPTTIVIDPTGRVVSTTVPPEQLTRAHLLALAAGKHVALGGPVPAKLQRQLDAAQAKFVAAQSANVKKTAAALFEITLTPGDKASGGKQPGTHMMVDGPGQMDVTNASPFQLLTMAARIPSTRISGASSLPDALYSLHVEAPGADPKQLAQAIELAVSTGAHVRIERQTSIKDAYVLTAKPELQGQLIKPKYSGFAAYTDTQTLMCINASLDQVASALEEPLGKPVINETGATGALTQNIKFPPKDLAAANKALGDFGLQLVSAQRSVETIALSPEPSSPNTLEPSGTPSP